MKEGIEQLEKSLKFSKNSHGYRGIVVLDISNCFGLKGVMKVTTNASFIDEYFNSLFGDFLEDYYDKIQKMFIDKNKKINFCCT